MAKNQKLQYTYPKDRVLTVSQQGWEQFLSFDEHINSQLMQAKEKALKRDVQEGKTIPVYFTSFAGGIFFPTVHGLELERTLYKRKNEALCDALSCWAAQHTVYHALEQPLHIATIDTHNNQSIVGSR
jgi:hypothetical protein